MIYLPAPSLSSLQRPLSCQVLGQGWGEWQWEGTELDEGGRDSPGGVWAWEAGRGGVRTGQERADLVEILAGGSWEGRTHIREEAVELGRSDLRVSGGYGQPVSQARARYPMSETLSGAQPSTRRTQTLDQDFDKASS